MTITSLGTMTFRQNCLEEGSPEDVYGVKETQKMVRTGRAELANSERQVAGLAWACEGLAKNMLRTS